MNATVVMCYVMAHGKSCWVSVLILLCFYSVESKDPACREAMFKAATNKGKSNFFTTGSLIQVGEILIAF